ncbi:GGDEF domain-containing protein [Desulforamulus reducens]|nr:GGDEF domain-containing protein [Desulforamulus reducens]
MDDARRPHPTVSSWQDYPDLAQSSLKTKNGVLVFPKPEISYEVITRENAMKLVQAVKDFSDAIVVDLGTDHRMPHYEAFIKAADTAFLVVDCDEKALVRLKSFIHNNAINPQNGWILAINSRERNATYSTKEFVRIAKGLNNVTKVIEIPFFKEIEKQFPKTFPPSSSVAKEIFNILQGGSVKKSILTDGIKYLKNNMSCISNSNEEEEISNQSFEVLINGELINYCSLKEINNIEDSIEAIFLPTDFSNIYEVIKELRRKTALQKVAIVTIGNYDSKLIESGADECFQKISPEVLKIVKTKAQKLRGLWHKANIDELTGCYQRNFMDECFNHAIQNHKEKGEPFSVNIFDLNDFKNINDTHGHNAGDLVLKAFGQHLCTTCRDIDIPIRSGGDEFILILPNETLETAKIVAERIRSSWQGVFTSPSGRFTATFSVGISQAGADGVTQEQLLNAADRRMYQDKQKFKSNVICKYKKITTNSLMVTTNLVEIDQLIQNNKKPLVVIDADKGQLINTLDINPNTAWQHDWRIGLAATPAKIGKKTELYSIPPDETDIEWEERDLRVLKEIVLQAIKAKKKVVIVADKLYPEISERLSSIS